MEYHQVAGKMDKYSKHGQRKSKQNRNELIILFIQRAWSANKRHGIEMEEGGVFKWEGKDSLWRQEWEQSGRALV